MRPVTVTVGPLAAASATNIRTASSGSAGALTFTGSPVTVPGFYTLPNGQKIAVASGQALLDAPRQILITNASNETATVTLSGYDVNGSPISEVVQLGNAGSSASVLSYAVLLSAVLSANSVGTLAIGTNTVASSPWVRFDQYADWPVTIQIDVVGTVNYSVQTSLDDPNSPTNPVAPASMTWFNAGDPAIVAATASAQSSFAVLPLYARVLLNSSTSPGAVMATFVQTGGGAA